MVDFRHFINSVFLDVQEILGWYIFKIGRQTVPEGKRQRKSKELLRSLSMKCTLTSMLFPCLPNPKLAIFKDICNNLEYVASLRLTTWSKFGSSQKSKAFFHIILPKVGEKDLKKNFAASVERARDENC